MKTIEEKMLKAINERRNFVLSNTRVEILEDGQIWVYLHNNNICRILKDGTRLFSNCGWRTNTTKSRLNALGAGIYQRNFVWYAEDGKRFENDFN